MPSRTSPFVVVSNGLRVLGQLAVAGAIVVAAISALSAWGYQSEMVVDAVHGWLVRVVTG